MKKVICSIIVLLFAVCISYAQEMQQIQQVQTVQTTEALPQLRLGIKAGTNFSSLNTTNDANARMITGLNLGVFTKIPVAPLLAIQPELYITTKGAAVSYNNLIVDGTANFYLNYLEIPILLVINLSPNFNFHIGPYVSYLMGANAKNESNVHLFNFENNLKVNDFNRFDAGVVAGLGIDIGGISLGARYNLGMQKVGKERTILGTTYTIPDANNSVITLYASISIN